MTTLIRHIKSYNVTCEFNHEQYWQGHGICFTPYDDCATGNGSSPAEALDDCLESLAQSDIRLSDEQVAEITSDVQGVYGKDFDVSDDTEDHYYYVSIDVEYSEPENPDFHAAFAHDTADISRDIAQHNAHYSDKGSNQ